VLNQESIDSKRNRYEAAAKQSMPSKEENYACSWRRIRGLMAITVMLTICFGRPLYDLAWYSLHSDLCSYIPLVPLISLSIPDLVEETKSGPGIQVCLAIGCAAAVRGRCHTRSLLLGRECRMETRYRRLSRANNAFLPTIVSGWLFRISWARDLAHAFPLGFLIFTVPFPGFLQGWMESFLQHCSAQAADVLFQISDTPSFRQDLVFELPAIALRVAPECSGIHSTLVLFITGLLAGHLFLRGPRHRVVLTLSVIPLAILRNGFRIFIIGQLCVHVSPDMINSYIHRHGGPIFFALSLIPFFLLLVILQKIRA
jgi:exosortase C (VPDSG-CTERM-specific)